MNRIGREYHALYRRPVKEDHIDRELKALIQRLRGRESDEMHWWWGLPWSSSVRWRAALDCWNLDPIGYPHLLWYKFVERASGSLEAVGGFGWLLFGFVVGAVSTTNAPSAVLAIIEDNNKDDPKEVEPQ